jgi:methionyl aminopeptidase
LTVTPAGIEGTGANYTLEKMLDVRLRTRFAVYKIAKQICPGMVEEDARAMARDVLKALGMRRGWHHIITRLGPNTTKDFMALSDRGVMLEDNDIFFIDIGPIYGDTEGDAGETFVVGEDPEHHKAKADVRAIWDNVRERWFSTGATGEELYDFAQTEAKERGWKLNLDLSGHRLSDFPHSAHYDGSLADVGFRPNSNLWVLEIAIIHPDRKFGAFYEDLLLPDQHFPDWALAAGGFPLAADGFPSAAAGFPLSADGLPLG